MARPRPGEQRASPRVGSPTFLLVKRHLEPVGSAFHVADHGPPRRGCIASLDGLEDSFVLGPRGRPSPRRIGHALDPDLHETANGLHDLEEGLIARRPCDPQVEVHVGADELVVVRRPLHDLHAAPQLRQGGFVTALRSQSGQQDLQLRARLHEVLGTLGPQQEPPLDGQRQERGVRALEVRAVTLAGVHEAQHGQRLDGLADVGAADAERLRQLPLGWQPLTGLDLPGDEVVEQPTGDLRGDGFRVPLDDGPQVGQHGGHCKCLDRLPRTAPWATDGHGRAVIGRTDAGHHVSPPPP